MTVCKTIMVTLLAPSAAPPGADAALARTLLQRLERHHARTADLVARFTQSYRSGMLGREVTERGVVSIKRPGRMRWEYKDPEPKLFVSDGKTFYLFPTPRPTTLAAAPNGDLWLGTLEGLTLVSAPGSGTLIMVAVPGRVAFRPPRRR